MRLWPRQRACRNGDVSICWSIAGCISEEGRGGGGAILNFNSKYLESLESGSELRPGPIARSDRSLSLSSVVFRLLDCLGEPVPQTVQSRLLHIHSIDSPQPSPLYYQRLFRLRIVLVCVFFVSNVTWHSYCLLNRLHVQNDGDNIGQL